MNTIATTQPLLPRSSLRAVQRRALVLVEKLERAGLFLPAGAGKTVILQTALVDLNERAGRRHLMLWVAPPAVAATVPSFEARKWEHLRHLEVVPLVGTPAQRAALLTRSDADVLTISYALLPWLAEHAHLLGRVPDMLVLDESSKIASPRSKTHRTAVALARQVPRCYCLTATPNARGFDQLWGQLYPLDWGQRLGRTYGQFVARWFVPYGQFDGVRLRNRQAELEITQAISDLCVSARIEELVDLPPLVNQRHEVILPPGARAEYDRAEAGLLLGREIDPTIVLGKLTQIADGVVLDHAGVARTVHDAKLVRLIELIDEIDEPVIVVYRYRATREQLLARVRGAVGWESTKAAKLIEDFATGRIRVLVAHALSFGHGIDGLQRGTRHLIWFGPALFSLEQKLQTEARIHRHGTSAGTVFVHTLHAVDTIDQVVEAVLAQRIKGADRVIEALAGYLRGRHGSKAGPDLEERLKAARAAAQRSHPDKGGNAAEFIKAKAELDAIKRQIKESADGASHV